MPSVSNLANTLFSVNIGGVAQEGAELCQTVKGLVMQPLGGSVAGLLPEGATGSFADDLKKLLDALGAAGVDMGAMPGQPTPAPTALDGASPVGTEACPTLLGIMACLPTTPDAASDPLAALQAGDNAKKTTDPLQSLFDAATNAASVAGSGVATEGASPIQTPLAKESSIELTLRSMGLKTPESDVAAKPLDTASPLDAPAETVSAETAALLKTTDPKESANVTPNAAATLQSAEKLLPARQDVPSEVPVARLPVAHDAPKPVESPLDIGRVDSSSTKTLERTALDTAPLLQGEIPRKERDQTLESESFDTTLASSMGDVASAKHAAADAAVKPSRLDHAAALDQIRDAVAPRMDELRREGRTEVHLHLNPPELGSVRVHLTIGEDRVQARLVVQEEGTRQMLESQLPGLRHRLEDLGLTLSRFDVTRDGPGQGSNGGRQQDWTGHDAEKLAAPWTPAKPQTTWTTPAPTSSGIDVLA